jgi:hypothetical protein
MPEPENLVLHLLREMREESREDSRRLGARVDGLGVKVDDLGADVRSELHSLRADVASDLLNLEKRVNDQFVALRRSVMEYHSTTIGHGMLYSELDERVRRIEQRLDLSPSEPH